MRRAFHLATFLCAPLLALCSSCSPEKQVTGEVPSLTRDAGAPTAYAPDPLAPAGGAREEAPHHLPPALSGGTLLLLRDGHTAVAADPDRDCLWVIDLPTEKAGAVYLDPGDEPGRLVEDAAGRVHVVLRRGGAIADLDPASSLAPLLSRRAVCPAPRGIAFDAATDRLHVVCAGGELVTLPAAGGAKTTVRPLERDLRDVVVDGDRLLISKFRAAELLVVDGAGTIVQRLSPPGFSAPSVRAGATFSPAVAWRTIGLGGGRVAMLPPARAGLRGVDPAGRLRQGHRPVRSDRPRRTHRARPRPEGGRRGGDAGRPPAARRGRVARRHPRRDDRGGQSPRRRRRADPGP
ncbi:MAG: hypothetical protein EXR72_12050 [Myxococcales bacterium]|nr:hypothetical protein [Myxococcales bacterium]